MPKLYRSKKNALFEHIANFRENTEVKGLKQEVEEMRIEIKNNKLSIITRKKKK